MYMRKVNECVWEVNLTVCELHSVDKLNSFVREFRSMCERRLKVIVAKFSLSGKGSL